MVDELYPHRPKVCCVVYGSEWTGYAPNLWPVRIKLIHHRNALLASSSVLTPLNAITVRISWVWPVQGLALHDLGVVKEVVHCCHHLGGDVLSP
jgi:hypothetical protein